MSPKEREYYRERALVERERAATATSVAAGIHLELACIYERLVGVNDEKPTLSIFTPERLSA